MKMLGARGFSMVGVMISLALLGVGAVAMMKLNQTNVKALNSTESKSEILAVTGDIRTILSSPQACLESLSGLNASSSNINEIKNPAGIVKYASGQQIGKIKLMSLSLSDSDPAVAVSASAVGDTYLSLEFDKGNATYVRDMVKRIKLWVETDASKNIVACRALSSGESNIWQRSSSYVEDIFFNGGFVGIGTNSPGKKLHVEGGIQGKKGTPSGANASSSGLSFGSDGDTGVFSPGDGQLDLWSDNNRALTVRGARVGIARSAPATALDVNGGIKVGSQSSCNSTYEGTMRYNSSDKVMQYCDGSGWKNIGGAPTCEVKSKNMPATHACGGGTCSQQTVECDSGWTRTGGGCSNSWYDGYRISKSYPVGANGWGCTAQPDSHVTSGSVYVICCK